MSAYTKHLAKVTSQLADGETILGSVDATLKVPARPGKGETARFGALVATSTRLVYSGSLMLAVDHRAVPWRQVTALELEVGLNGTVVVQTAAGPARYLLTGEADAFLAVAHEQVAAAR